MHSFNQITFIEYLDMRATFTYIDILCIKTLVRKKNMPFSSIIFVYGLPISTSLQALFEESF